MDFAELKPNAKNPRKITDKKLKDLKKSMDKFGDLGGIVFNKRSGQVVGGHQRISLLQNGEIEIGEDGQGFIIKDGHKFALRVVDWDASTEKAANIAANKGAGEWDMDRLGEWFKELDDENFDLDLTMFDEEERAQFLIEPEVYPEGLTDPDSISENVETRCKLGDLWLLGNHRLLCGDSTDVLQVERLMGGEKAELCFTSPPYSDQREYNGGKELSTEHLATFIRVSFSHVNYFAVNLGMSRKNGEINCYWDDYIKEAKNCGLKLLSWNIWDRSGLGVSIGNQIAMFPIWHEWIFVFGSSFKEINRTKENKTVGSKSGTNRQSDGSLKKGKGITQEFGKIGTVLFTSVADGKLHPAMFPVELPEAYILACTDPNKIVYEPFCGSGTTIIACEKTKRECYGMEIDPHYCDIIIERWEKFTGQKAVLMAGGQQGG